MLSPAADLRLQRLQQRFSKLRPPPRERPDPPLAAATWDSRGPDGGGRASGGEVVLPHHLEGRLADLQARLQAQEHAKQPTAAAGWGGGGGGDVISPVRVQAAGTVFHDRRRPAMGPSDGHVGAAVDSEDVSRFGWSPQASLSTALC